MWLCVSVSVWHLPTLMALQCFFHEIVGTVAFLYKFWCI